jgi:SAM-dependent methyltransferase
MKDHTENPKSIKSFMLKYIAKNQHKFKDKIVIDLPAGNGITTKILLQYGAKPYPFDLFPEFFQVDGIECLRADVNQGIPVQSYYADILICQEGIEHFTNQQKALKEFNRVLKTNGELIITTPSYSCLLSRFSYFMFESEKPLRIAPNELDDIWMADRSISNEIYHGHIFLIGLQKLRVLALLAGFKIVENHYTRLSKGSLVLLIFLYPMIYLHANLSYFKSIKKENGVTRENKKEVYKEQLKMNISLSMLLSRHTFIVLKKERELNQIDFSDRHFKITSESIT